jgi:hypothetical protein
MPPLPLIPVNPNQLPVPNDPLGLLLTLILNEAAKRSNDKKIHSHLEKVIDVANKQGTKAGVQGAIGSFIAANVASKVVTNAPGIFQQALEKAGVGGYERGTRDAKEMALQAFVFAIQSAGPLELVQFINQLVSLNAPLRIVRNVAVTVALGTTTYYVAKHTIGEIIKYRAETVARESVTEMLRKSCVERLIASQERGSITSVQFQQYTKDLTLAKSVQEINEFTAKLSSLLR